MASSFFHSLFHTRPTPAPDPEFPELAHDQDTNSHKVIELVRYKTAAGSWYKPKQHQKVIAKVETDEAGAYGYVCFERDPKKRLRYNTLRDLVSGSSEGIDFVGLLDSLIEDGMPITEASTIFEMKREPVVRDEESTVDSDTDDTLSHVTHHRPKGIWVQRLETLKPTNLRLCDLAMLVSSIHDLNAVYSVFHAQRLWFANLIMRVVEKDDEREVQGPVPVFGVERCGWRRRRNEDEVCSAAGRWYKVWVSRTMLVIVEMVREQYHEIRRKVEEREEQVV